MNAPRSLRPVLAAVIGNALEWYDFVVFGYFSAVIGRLFFPAADEAASLMLSFATFGAGFCTRPLGAVVLGLLADRAGRKRALQTVIVLMTLAVGLLAAAPTYATIGLAAPLIVLAARLLQGFATGGEFASATSYLVECAPPGRHGLFGSLQMVGQGTAALLGAGAAAAATRLLAPAQLDAWGWRLPLVAGLLIGPVGLYMRRHLEETAEFRALAQRPAARMTLARLWRESTAAVAASFLLVVCGTTAYYVVLLYMPTWARTRLGLTQDDAFLAQVLALLWLVLLTPLFGALSDRIGRRPLLRAAALLYLALPWPVFEWALAAPSFGRLLGLQLCLCSVVAMLFGPIATCLAEQFPAGRRSTGMAIAYNFGVMLFGGFAPVLVIWLMQVTGSGAAPAYYIMFGAVSGLAATLWLRERTAPPAP